MYEVIRWVVKGLSTEERYCKLVLVALQFIHEEYFYNLFKHSKKGNIRSPGIYIYIKSYLQISPCLSYVHLTPIEEINILRWIEYLLNLCLLTSKSTNRLLEVAIFCGKLLSIKYIKIYLFFGPLAGNVIYRMFKYSLPATKK